MASQYFFTKLFFLLTFGIISLNAQDPRETQIRSLEIAEKEAVLHSDTAALFYKYWSNNLVVHTPDNNIMPAGLVKARVKGNQISYTAFERKIERIFFNGDLGVAMGEETVIPGAGMLHGGKKITRRYTNVWAVEEGQWKLIIRQATVISME